jgi:hypothetical protein
MTRELRDAVELGLEHRHHRSDRCASFKRLSVSLKNTDAAEGEGQEQAIPSA